MGSCIPISLHYVGGNLWYFRLWLFDQAQFIIQNINGPGCKDKGKKKSRKFRKKSKETLKFERHLINLNKFFFDSGNKLSLQFMKKHEKKHRNLTFP